MQFLSTSLSELGLVVSVSVVLLFASDTVAVDRDHLIQQMSTRSAALNRIEVTFHFHEERQSASVGDSEDMANSRPGQAAGQAIPLTGPASGESRFLRAGKLVRFERRETSDSTQPPMPLLPSPDIKSYSSSRAEHRFGNNGTIKDTGRWPSDSTIDLALGFRAKGFDEWLTMVVLNEGTFHETDAGTVTLEWRPSDSKDKNRRKDRWTFDPKRGYALIRYELQWKPEGSDDFVTDTEIINGDFQTVSGVQVPFSVSAKSYFNQAGAEPVLMHSVEIAVDSYRIGEIEESDEAFLIEWPDGAVVLDERNGQTYVVKDGPKQLTDEVIQAAFGRGLPDAQERASSRRTWGMLLIVNCLAAVALLGYYAFHRSSRRAR